MLKKGQLTKQLKRVQKNNQFLRRVVEGLFLSNAGPKRGCLSYLIEIREIFHISDVYFLTISIRYDKHILFGPAFVKMKHSTTIILEIAEPREKRCCRIRNMSFSAKICWSNVAKYLYFPLKKLKHP